MSGSKSGSKPKGSEQTPSESKKEKELRTEIFQLKADILQLRTHALPHQESLTADAVAALAASQSELATVKGKALVAAADIESLRGTISMLKDANARATAEITRLGIKAQSDIRATERYLEENSDLRSSVAVLESQIAKLRDEISASQTEQRKLADLAREKDKIISGLQARLLEAELKAQAASGRSSEAPAMASFTKPVASSTTALKTVESMQIRELTLIHKGMISVNEHFKTNVEKLTSQINKLRTDPNALRHQIRRLKEPNDKTRRSLPSQETDTKGLIAEAATLERQLTTIRSEHPELFLEMPETPRAPESLRATAFSVEPTSSVREWENLLLSCKKWIEHHQSQSAELNHQLSELIKITPPETIALTAEIEHLEREYDIIKNDRETQASLFRLEEREKYYFITKVNNLKQHLSELRLRLTPLLPQTETHGAPATATVFAAGGAGAFTGAGVGAGAGAGAGAGSSSGFSAFQRFQEPVDTSEISRSSSNSSGLSEAVLVSTAISRVRPEVSDEDLELGFRFLFPEVSEALLMSTAISRARPEVSDEDLELGFRFLFPEE
jgi:chromosome segregation ATPase